MNHDFDVAILGAGPAGTSAAICLSGKGLKVVLIDKGVFPRDKICGDALSPDVLSQLKKMGPSLAKRMEVFDRKERINGIRVYPPNYTKKNLKFALKSELNGYVVSREDFDNVLAEEVKSKSDIDFLEGISIQNVERLEDGVVLSHDGGEISAKLLIACDGINSQVAKQFMDYRLDRKHHCGALRVYYEGVEFESRDCIELHFIKDVLPGYFWVFPMSGNRANVGIGMLSDFVSKNNVNLKSTLQEVIKNHPTIAPRFKNAKPLESIKGMGIPIGSRKYQLSTDRIMLAGDAACLVDPMTGEGIGNAIRSGRFAADFAISALAKEDFSAANLMHYDARIYDAMGKELQMGHFFQKIARHRRLLNFILVLMGRSQALSRFLMRLFEDYHFLGNWHKPSTYWRIITGKKKAA